MLQIPPPKIDLAPYWAKDEWMPDNARVVWSGSATSVGVSALIESERSPGFFILKVASGQRYGIFVGQFADTHYGAANYGTTASHYARCAGATFSVFRGSSSPGNETLIEIQKA